MTASIRGGIFTMAMLLKGAEVAKALTEELHAKTEELKKNGVEPCLAILRVGAREDDLAYDIPIKGKRVVVIGRSLVIGKPVSLLLLAEHATVTICHSRSENLPEICREADILVVAAGKAGMVGAESVRAGQVVLDVGIHVGADGNLCGDTRFAEVEPVVEAITPVPGGVGTVTSTILASHVVEAAERAANQ